MDTFFSSVLKANFNNREHLIKQSIVERLSENIKEIQYDLKKDTGSDLESNQLDLCDSTQTLCTIIEAIFLHGVKGSFLRQTINVLADGNVNRKPAVHFWPPLLVFSHKYAIAQIQSMTQITTEIGNCRCWIRQSLNDCLLSSYLSNMRKNTQALEPYYQRTAFVRDPDCMEIAESLISGMEACVSFNLPLNSSLLNQWTDHPLQIAGLYTPAVSSYPIAAGIDVVNSNLSESSSQTPVNHLRSAHEIPIECPDMENQNSIPIPRPLLANEFFASSIHNSPFNKSTMQSALFLKQNKEADKATDDDDVALAIDCNTIDSDIEHDVQLTALLSRVDQMSTCPTVTKDDPNDDSKEDIKKNDLTYEDDLLTESTSSMGNSLTLRRGWSSQLAENDEEQSMASEKKLVNRSNSLNESTSTNRANADQHSYNALIRNQTRMDTQGEHNKQGIYLNQIDFNEVWQRFEASLGATSSLSDSDVRISPVENKANESEDDITNEALQDFEFVESLPDHFSAQFTIPELQFMVKQTFKITRELGLDAQKFSCLSCEKPLGVGSTSLTVTHVCGFNGSYYCSDCMASDFYQIPARVIYNWDFRKFPVSQKAAAFLQEFQYQPFIDLKLLNPDIYRYVDEMAELQSLRIQLNYIRAYLFTCCAPIIENLQKQLWSKEYLYEHIHRYSMADLQMIPKGLLADQLRKAITFGRQHILDCVICSQKGFICEICQSDRVLYPFDVTTTFKCDQCGSVFHAECLNAMHPCPKCERKRKREIPPLLDE